MKRLVIASHALLVILAYSAPFWLDWRLVVIGIGVYWLQIIVLKTCVLSQAQFHDQETTFHEWYLAKLGIKPNKLRLKKILNFWIPLVLITTAFLLQYYGLFDPIVDL